MRKEREQVKLEQPRSKTGLTRREALRLIGAGVAGAGISYFKAELL